MASGPVSYNHGKLNKPIDYYPDFIQLIGVYEDTTLSPSATRNCVGCVPPIAFFASRTLFSAVYHTNAKHNRTHPSPHTSSSGWKSTERTNDNDLGELANPKTRFGVYLSGAGGKASMMKYNDKWWIVFGSDKKRKMKRITLHVPTVETNVELLDRGVNDFFDFLRGTINENA